jgi:hypothetical protein
MKNAPSAMSLESESADGYSSENRGNENSPRQFAFFQSVADQRRCAVDPLRAADRKAFNADLTVFLPSEPARPPHKLN